MPDVIIVHRPDTEITEPEDRDLKRLLLACFPYETALLTRRYIHEPPAHRWLARTPVGDLAAHVAMHDKRIAVGGHEVRIGGIAEVCVAHEWRGRGLVRMVLAEVHTWMEAESIPFAMLFGQARIYGSSGYRVIGNPIVETGSMLHRLNPFKGKPMIREMGAGSKWPDGAVDLRGPSF